MKQGHRAVKLASERGRVTVRYYPASGARKAVVMVGGVGGDFDTPARGLYPRVAGVLQGQGVASLQVKFRFPSDLDESVFDLITGIGFLRGEGVRLFGLMGHSLGGAVVAHAASQSPVVVSCVLLSTQCYGAEPIAHLGRDVAVLLVHGKDDDVLPFSCSVVLYEHIQGLKRLVLIVGAGHCLDEDPEQVFKETTEWLRTTLGG